MEGIIVAKVVITETSERETKWPAAFGKLLNTATSQKWVSEGWHETDQGWWNLVFSNSEYRLTLKFSDGSYGYILTSYTLNILGSAVSDSVVRVFNNNKELFGLVNDSITKLKKKSDKATPGGKSDFFLAIGLIFEDGYYDLPKDLKVVFPADNFDKNNKEPQFLIAWKKFQAVDIDSAREELTHVKKSVLSYWQEGYYPPAYGLANLATSKMVNTNISSESHGYLGNFDGKKYTINDALKLSKVGGKISAALLASYVVAEDTVTTFHALEKKQRFDKSQARLQRFMLTQAQITGTLNDAIGDGQPPMHTTIGDLSEFHAAIGFEG